MSQEVVPLRDRLEHCLLVSNAMELIYGNAASRQETLTMLESSQRPEEALAEASVTIVRSLNQKGTTQAPVLLRAAAGDVLEMLAEIAQAFGLFEVNETTMTAAAQRVREMFLN
jgi:hypothetical protein